MSLATTRFIPTKKYTFEELRYLISVLMLGQVGVLEQNAYKVSPRAAGANMSVDVEGGNALVVGGVNTQQGMYHQIKNGVDNVAPVEANASGKPRIDGVILVVNDSSVLGVSDTPALAIMKGVPTTGANLGNVSGALSATEIKAVHPNFLFLAYVEVINGASKIESGNIQDQRVKFGPRREIEALENRKYEVVEANAGRALSTPYTPNASRGTFVTVAADAGPTADAALRILVNGTIALGGDQYTVNGHVQTVGFMVPPGQHWEAIAVFGPFQSLTSTYTFLPF